MVTFLSYLIVLFALISNAVVASMWDPSKYMEIVVSCVKGNANPLLEVLDDERTSTKLIGTCASRLVRAGKTEAALDLLDKCGGKPFKKDDFIDLFTLAVEKRWKDIVRVLLELSPSYRENNLLIEYIFRSGFFSSKCSHEKQTAAKNILRIYLADPRADPTFDNFSLFRWLLKISDPLYMLPFLFDHPFMEFKNAEYLALAIKYMNVYTAIDAMTHPKLDRNEMRKFSEVVSFPLFLRSLPLINAVMDQSKILSDEEMNEINEMKPELYLPGNLFHFMASNYGRPFPDNTFSLLALIKASMSSGKFEIFDLIMSKMEKMTFPANLEYQASFLTRAFSLKRYRFIERMMDSPSFQKILSIPYYLELVVPIILAHNDAKSIELFLEMLKIAETDLRGLLVGLEKQRTSTSAVFESEIDDFRDENYHIILSNIREFAESIENNHYALGRFLELHVRRMALHDALLFDSPLNSDARKEVVEFVF